LDVTSQKMVIKMLRDMMESGFIKGMIFITHELPLLYNVADEIMVMYAGQIVEHATAKQAVFDRLPPLFQRVDGCNRSCRRSGLRDIKLTAIPGCAEPRESPAGCRFAERCQYARAVCRGRRLCCRLPTPTACTAVWFQKQS
jgi:peptide/nickel transport system ATP-binding protein